MSRAYVKGFKDRKFAHRSLVPCFYCGLRLQKHEATVDHVVPKSRGGLDHHTNLVIACHKHNQAKADRSAASLIASEPWNDAAREILGRKVGP